MKIGITSLVDLDSSAHNRLHQFIKYLLRGDDITVISINKQAEKKLIEWWK